MKIIIEIIQILVNLFTKNKLFKSLLPQGVSATWKYGEKIITLHISFSQLNMLETSAITIIKDAINKHAKVDSVTVLGNVITVNINV